MAATQAPTDRLGPPALVSLRTAGLLAVGTGALYFLAFPGIDLWPLAFVTWVPLLIALEGRSLKQALGLGWLAGFTMTMLGFYWLLEMLKTFSGFSTPLCLLFMALLCGYQAGRIALMGGLYQRGVARGWPAGGVLALAFITSELIYPLLFTWYFGATVHQLTPLTQIAELGSPIAVGLVLLASNWALFRWLRWRRLPALPRPPWLSQLALLVVVPALAATYGLLRIRDVEASLEPLPKIRTGIVQANMSLLAKRRDRYEGLRRHLRLTHQLTQAAPLDLVVWSETSVAGAVAEGDAAQFYSRLFTRQLGVPAIFGAVLRRPIADERGYVLFNSALSSSENGAITGRFDKHFLLAFGEYLPFGDWFPVLYSWSPNTGKFAPGETMEPLRVGEHRIAAHICYEDISPSFVNQLVRESDPDLLVNLTNDAWFGNSTEPWIHLALATFRAIEHRRYLVRSTNSGISAFVDPLGRVVKHSQPFEAQALALDIAYTHPEWTPYELYGDAPWWLASLVMIGACFVRRPDPNQSTGVTESGNSHT